MALGNTTTMDALEPYLAMLLATPGECSIQGSQSGPENWNTVNSAAFCLAISAKDTLEEPLVTISLLAPMSLRAVFEVWSDV